VNADILFNTATLDVKLKAPNGTNVTVKGKQAFEGATSGSVRLSPRSPRRLTTFPLTTTPDRGQACSQASGYAQHISFF
jgi:hypothetical protein